MTLRTTKILTLAIALALVGGVATTTFAQSGARTPQGSAVCTTLENTLHIGLRDRNTGGEVSELQAFLRAEGYLKKRGATGFFNLQTYRAVRAFQKHEGLRVTGVVNAETRAAIQDESCGAEEQDDLLITSIDAPSALLVNEEGEWTVHVEGEGEGNLQYSVKWGDEGMLRTLFSADDDFQTSATFTHSYSGAGTYTPEFTVKDAAGNIVTKAAGSVTVSEEAEVEVTISSLSVSSGEEGDELTITGTGFASDSSVYIGDTKVTNVTVNSDTSITLTIPAISAGTYDLYVENADGMSNKVSFEVTEEEAVRVSISGLDAPVRLKVGQEGTWTVNTDTNADSLTYAATWGDEGSMMLRASAMTQTSSTFTHSYSKAGTYKPTFTVTDASGVSAKVSATVLVTN